MQTNPLYRARELETLYADSGVTVVVSLDLFLPNVLLAKPKTSIRDVVVADLADWLPRTLSTLYPIRRRRALKKAEGWPLAIPREPWVHAFRELLRSPPMPEEATAASSEDVAVLQYTGGTTGVPKGAMLTNSSLLANAFQCASWVRDARPGEERMLLTIPVFHAYGLTVGVLMSIKLAATMILHPNPRETAGVLKLIAKAHPTMFPGVPTMFASLLDHPGLSPTTLRGITWCLSGSAPLPLEVRRKFEALTGGKLVESYGLTETSAGAAANPLIPDGLVKECVGIPLPDTDIKIVDPESGARDVPAGEPGEVVIRGPQLMKGYWRNPQETAAALRGGWLFTGDIGRMDEDGYLYIVERKKDVIIASGYKVYPREVEEVLYSHSAVAEAAALGVPDPRRGETVKAFIVLKAGSRATDQELIEFCRKRLAPFKVPTVVEFRTTLPKSLVGKVLRSALRGEARGGG